MIELELPLPPSVNECWVNRKSGEGKGRIRSERYDEWLVAAGWLIQSQRFGKKWPSPHDLGVYLVEISIPEEMRGDSDGRNKQLLDLLVKQHVTLDDKHCWGGSWTRDPSLEVGMCRVVVKPKAAP